MRLRVVRARQAPPAAAAKCKTPALATAQQMEGLFEPFRQADSSITRRFGGTGQLVIARQLAQAMGGETGAQQNRPWQHLLVHGAPATRPHQRLGARGTGTTPEPPSLGVGQTAGLRVLVVDDNEVNLQVAQGLRKPVASRVDQARTAPEAVDQLTRAADHTLRRCADGHADAGHGWPGATRALRALPVLKRCPSSP